MLVLGVDGLEIVLEPRLDLLELVGFLADMGDVRLLHCPPLQETEGLAGTHRAVDPCTLRLGVGAELPHHVPICLQPHHLGILPLVGTSHLISLTGVPVDPGQLLPLAWIRLIRCDGLEPGRVDAGRMPEGAHMPHEQEVEWFDLVGPRLPRVEVRERLEEFGTRDRQPREGAGQARSAQGGRRRPRPLQRGEPVTRPKERSATAGVPGVGRRAWERSGPGGLPARGAARSAGGLNRGHG